jgi:hypothetical protein
LTEFADALTSSMVGDGGERGVCYQAAVFAEEWGQQAHGFLNRNNARARN